MALEPNPLRSAPLEVPEEKGSLWGDVPKAVAAGTTDLAAQGVGLFADLADSPRDGVTRLGQQALNEVTRTIDESISPASRRAMESEVFGTGEGKQSVFEAPARAAVMKLSRMAPMLAGFALMPSGGLGVLAGTAAGGAQAVAQQLNDTRKAVDEMPDLELQKKSRFYREWREAGMDEDAARERLTNEQANATNLVLTAIGGGAGGGALGHAMKGATKGLVRGAAVGALEAAVGGGAMGGAAEAGRQIGERDTGGRDELDAERIALAALNTGVEMSALGGVASGVRGAMTGRPKRAPETVRPDPEVDAALKKHLAPDEERPPTADEIIADVEKNTAEDAPGGLEEKLAEIQRQEAPPATVEQPVAPAPAIEIAKPPVMEQPPVPAEAPLPVEVTPPVEAAPKPELPTVTREEMLTVGSVDPKASWPAIKEWNKANPETKISFSDLQKEAARPAKEAKAKAENDAKAERAAERQRRIDEKVAQREQERLTATEVDTALKDVPKKEAPKPPEDQTVAEMNSALSKGVAEAITPPVAPRKVEVVITRPKKAAAPVVEAPKVTPAGNEAPRAPRVLKATNETPAEKATRLAAEKARKEANETVTTNIVQEKRRETLVKKADDEAGRRLRKVLNNEEKAERAVHETKPDREATKHVEDAEAAAMEGGAKAPFAYDFLAERAQAVVDKAEADGVVIPPSRTTSSRLVDSKNPTPYLSHLTRLKKYLAMHKAWKEHPASQPRFAENAREHAASERAMRTGDTEGANASRIEKNNEMNKRHREGGVLDETREEGNTRRADDDEVTLEDADRLTDTRLLDGDETLQSGNREETDANYYEARHREGHHTETVADTFARVRDEIDADFNSTPESEANRVLLHQVMEKIEKVAGDTPIHYVNDAQFDRELTGRMSREQATASNGVFTYYSDGLNQQGKRGTIMLRHSADPVHVAIHEAAHAATSHALAQDGRLYNDVQSMMDWALQGANDQLALLRQYGMTNPHEFIAEALSRPEFRAHLAKVTVPDSLAKEWRVDKGQNAWKSLVQMVGRALGIIKRAELNLLEAVLIKSDELMSYKVTKQAPGLGRTEASLASMRERLPSKDTVQDFTGTPTTWKHGLQRIALKLATRDQWAQVGDYLFKGAADKPHRVLSDLLARMAREKGRITQDRDEGVIRNLAKLERKYAKTEQWKQFADLLHDETVTGVWADRPLDKNHPHGDVKKDSMEGWQANARHSDLQARFNALPDDLKAVRADLHSYFRERQNTMSLDIIKNIVTHVNGGKPFDALAQRIFDKKLTDADKKLIEGDAALKALKEAKRLAQIAGPYVPLMRRGDYVVSGKYKIDMPANALRRVTPEGKADPEGNVFEFATRDEARKFAQDTPLKVTKAEKVYTDLKTGERYGVDDDGVKSRLTKEDAGSNSANEAYWVHVQDKHVEFHDHELAAKRAHRDLVAQGLVMANPEPKRWEPGGRNSSFLAERFEIVANSLRQRKSFQAMEKGAQEALLGTLRDASIMALGSTRAQSRRLPRTNVAGASHDITTNTQHYASSSAGYLARIRFQPKIDETLKAMEAYSNAMRHAKGEQGSNETIERGQYMAEIKKRLYSASEPEAQGFWHSAGSRLLQVSYLDKLASPAFHVINSMEPWTVSMPVLSARYGMGRTFAAMSAAYRDIGAGSALGAGLKDTAKAFKTDEGLTNYLQRFSDRLLSKEDGKHVVNMLNTLHDVGLIDRDAGLELARMGTPTGNLIGRGLDRADLMARQMGTAIESINRTVTAVAAYRMEFRRTKDHKAATEFARETVSNTMGDYSGANAAPIFNHPVGRLALQFKKYAQKTYFLLGKTAYQALKGNPEAMKAFAGIMGTHVLLAGALGLPLEAVKAAFLAAQLTGATGSNYGDFEQMVRRNAASLLGNAGGQIATRGLPRYLGVDLSSRVGLENLLLPMGELKSTKADDLFAYAGKALAGAPAGMITEWVQGAQAFGKGDYAEAARLWMPVKVFADTINAAQKYDHGKLNQTGRETLSPYSAGEAVTRAIGFTPGREAETGEMRGAMSHDQKRFAADRSALQQKWVLATPSDKTSMWRQIQEWNRDKPKDAQITMAQLVQMQQRRAAEPKSTYLKDGVRTNKRDDFLRRENNFYNIQ